MIKTEKIHLQDNVRLPAGWQWTDLGEVIIEAQSGFASGTRDLNGAIQLRMNNVNIWGNLVWDKFIRVPADRDTISKYQLLEGDVVFNNTNSVELVGKSALFSGYSEPVLYSNHFTRIRVAADRLESAYLAKWLIWQWQCRTFENICNRWIGQSAVKNDKLLALKIPLPPLSEQQRIAAILAKQMAAVQKARATAEVQLEAARELPAAYLRTVFESPEAQEWPRKRLGSLAAISGGIQKTPSRTPNSFHRPFLTVRNVQRGWLDLTGIERFEVTLYELSRYRLEGGDILIVEGNGSPDHIGRNAIFWGEIEDCIHQNHIIRVRLDKSQNDPEFVSRYLNSDLGKAQMLEKARTTTGLYTLSVSKIDQLEVVTPPLAVQQRIATKLREQMMYVEQVRKSLAEQLDAINQLPATLLRQAFNGEL